MDLTDDKVNFRGKAPKERSLLRLEAPAKQDGFPLIRFVTHMEWALEDRPGRGYLLEYEARANYLWLSQEGPFNPVICAYDLTKFGGDIVVDIMRTHPLVIIGGILHENPFLYLPTSSCKSCGNGGDLIEPC